MTSTPLSRSRAHRHFTPLVRLLPTFLALGLLWLLVELASHC